MRDAVGLLLRLAAAIAIVQPALAGEGPVSPERARRLEHMVIQDCGSCHGLTLKGGLGRPLTPDALAHARPDGLAAIILDGIPGTAMPPWRPILSEDDALWIAAYLLERKAR
jgi:cytochrome c55X